MRSWAVDDRGIRDQGLLVLESRRRPRLETGDSVVVFRRRGRIVEFTSHSRILSSDMSEDEGGAVVLNCALDGLLSLQPSRKLTDFTYTLGKIYRYEAPHRHFERRYVSLSEGDMRSIVDGTVFWARTAFGSYLNSLPADAVAAFVRELVEHDPKAIIRHSNYHSLWTRLREFITADYAAASDLVDSLAATVGEVNAGGTEVPWESIGISDEEEQRVDSVAELGRRLSRFVRSLGPEYPAEPGAERRYILLDRVDGRISDSTPTEQEFEKRFEGTPWPTVMTLSF